MSELALAVTSSTAIMGIAVGNEQGILAASVVEAERRHVEEVSPMLTQVLSESGIEIGQLGRIVVDVGPGRFTGLRVGVATVRALAFALEIPVVGLTSLEILAAGVGAHGSSAVVTSVVDARRNEVFQQRFDGGEAIGAAEVGKAEELSLRAEGVVVGDGLDRYLAAYRAHAELDCREEQIPDMVTMLRLGFEREPATGSSVSPFYLRDPDVNPNVKVRPHA